MIRQNALNNSSSQFNSPNKSISTPNKQTPTRKTTKPEKRRSKSSFSTLQSSKPKISTENRSKFQIKTYVRIRKELLTPETDDDNLIVPSFTHIGTNFTKIANSEKSYKFDQIFTPSDKQPVIFENVCEELLDSALRGFNVCIFAYGFTGTGKTFTMFGDRAELVGEESNLGMIQRMCKELFESNVASIKVSFYEIYAEKVRDLLQDSQDSASTVNLKVRESSDNSFYVDSLEFECKNLTTLTKVIDLGLSKRATSATTSNNHSSRSHAILSLSFEHKEKRSKIKLVDLAGAEHAGANYKNNKNSKNTPRKSMMNCRRSIISSNDTKNQQSLLNEGVMINRSLLTLGRCITILSSNEHETHVPYRESVITKLLKDSLGGNSKTAMIATCSEFQELEGLNSTLRFAESVSNITNHVQVNRSVETSYSTQRMLDLQSQIEKLENQLSVRDLELKNQITKPSLVLLTEDPSLSKMVVKVLPVSNLENVNADFEIFEDRSDNMDPKTTEIKIDLGFGNVIVNGSQLKPGVTTLFHGDRIVFDEETFYALNQPSSKNSVRTLINYQQAKDEHISALNSRLQEKDFEIDAQKNKLTEVEQMVKRQKFENFQNQEKIKTFEDERIRTLEKQKVKKMNKLKIAKDRRENVKKIQEELRKNKEGLDIDFRKDVLAKFREKRSSGEVDSKKGYMPKIQENNANSFIESLTGKRKSTDLSIVDEEESKKSKITVNDDHSYESSTHVPSVILHRPQTELTGSEFYQIIQTAKQLEYLVSYENVSNHTINCLIHSFYARVALFSETNRYSNFTNPDLTSESEKLSAKIKMSFDKIFDEFYTENSVFDVNELRTVIKHLVSYGLTLEEADFSGKWDFTDGFGKSVMFKAVREGAKSLLKKSIDRLDKQFCEIINENGMSSNDTFQKHKLKTIQLVEKTRQVLSILQKHLENCFEDYELNYEVTTEKLLKTGQKVLFSMIEFCAGVRQAVINALLEEGVVDDIDGIADLMTTLDNDALEFTVLFERDESGSMVKRMVDGFTELFDVLDELERDVGESLVDGDIESVMIDTFDKENLRVPVTPVFVRSSTLKSEYRTKSTMETYSPFRLE